ncbi:restriction endonuclease subunit S [Staphylococcus chromogenes]|uniref:restriction endonuclease subunit S n=1 Tax=Staphylococcus chromogenes TaxID=46126 RepID=UPI001F37CDA1|nr:restriction endonuclease subunit S [Staphylococcus chromogenes]MCE5043618.1 restriction endonuclease subunit S [Staphylococcus chromogenes]
MTNELRNVPDLRFQGFEGEWKNLKLNEVLEDKTNGIKRGPFGGALKKEIFVNHGYAVYEQKNAIYDNQSFRYYIDKKKYEQMKLFAVQPGDIIMSCSGTIGKLSKIPKNYKKGIINQALIRFRTNSHIYSQFFLIYMRSNVMQRKILEANPGSAITNLIPVKELKNLKFPLPTLEEQEKIGNFFSKLDRQIELEEQKLEKIKEQKKGYMQKIFSQELRFKDDNGNDYPNWENEILANLISEVNERTTSNNQYVLLSSTKNGLLSQEEYFKKQIGSKDSTGYKILRLNQLVLSPQNLWLGNININQRFDIGIVSPSYRIYNLSHKFYINFAKDLLKSPRYIYEYAQASEQGASVVRRNLNLELFYSIKVYLPSIEEQRKIGIFLSNFDEFIQKQSIKIEQLKQRKQGLLQKMFI